MADLFQYEIINPGCMLKAKISCDSNTCHPNTLIQYEREICNRYCRPLVEDQHKLMESEAKVLGTRTTIYDNHKGLLFMVSEACARTRELE